MSKLRGVSVSQKYLSTIDIPVQKRGHCGILAFSGVFRISRQGGGPAFQKDDPGKAMAAAETIKRIFTRHVKFRKILQMESKWKQPIYIYIYYMI